MPELGFGVYKIPRSATAETVAVAIEAGYRHIDTAAFYDNETEVGEAVRGCGIQRQDLFVTTKVWWTDNGYDSTLRAFDASLRRLGLDYVDLYMIHWPAPRLDQYVPAWRALQRLQKESRALSIGVANFHVHHLERLMAETGTTPVVNQVELHPWLPQRDLRRYHDTHGIVTQAWSPLARGRMLTEDTVQRLAHKHQVTPAQIVLRWQLRLGTVPIVKSTTPARIRTNLDVYSFDLDGADMAEMARLENGRRTGEDPDDRG